MALLSPSVTFNSTPGVPRTHPAAGNPTNPVVFFDINIGGTNAGRVVMEVCWHHSACLSESPSFTAELKLTILLLLLLLCSCCAVIRRRRAEDSGEFQAVLHGRVSVSRWNPASSSSAASHSFTIVLLTCPVSPAAAVAGHCEQQERHSSRLQRLSLPPHHQRLHVNSSTHTHTAEQQQSSQRLCAAPPSLNPIPSLCRSLHSPHSGCRAATSSEVTARA
jgi:hypothetical protein